MATNNSNGTCPAKQPACPKTSPQRLAQKATTITPTWQAYSQNSSLLVTVHHQDTSSLLGQGRQSLLSISPHTFPPHCFPAQIQGQKPHFIRATTGSNSTKSSMPKQLLQMHNGVLHKEHELMLQPLEKQAAFVVLAQEASFGSPLSHSRRASLLHIHAPRYLFPPLNFAQCLAQKRREIHKQCKAKIQKESKSRNKNQKRKDQKAKEGKAKSPEKPRNKEEHPEGGRKEFQEWEREKYQSPHLNITKVLQHRSSNKARLTKERQTTRKTEQSKTKTRNTRVQHMNSRQHHRKAKHRKTGPLPRHRHTLI